MKLKTRFRKCQIVVVAVGETPQPLCAPKRFGDGASEAATAVQAY